MSVSITVGGFKAVNANQLVGITISSVAAAANSIYQLVSGVWTAVTSLAGITLTSPTFTGTVNINATGNGTTNIGNSGSNTNNLIGANTITGTTTINSTGNALTQIGNSTATTTLIGTVNLNATGSGTTTIGNASSTTNVVMTAGFVDARTQASGVNTVWRSNITGDGTNDRFILQANGNHLWGGGAATSDVRIARSAAGVLTVDDSNGGTGGVRFANSTTNYSPSTLNYWEDGGSIATTVTWGAAASASITILLFRRGIDVWAVIPTWTISSNQNAVPITTTAMDARFRPANSAFDKTVQGQVNNGAGALSSLWQIVINSTGTISWQLVPANGSAVSNNIVATTSITASRQLIGPWSTAN
jgi:hypothetical protein